MSLFEDASLVVTPNGRKASKIYSIKPTDGSGDLTVVRATTATEVNSSGVIVDVASNVARFDYTNGSCPSILVEPQRTNLVLRSEPTSSEGPSGNITYESFSWTNGFTNCTRFLNNAAIRFRYAGTVVVGTTYTISAFVIMDDLSKPSVGFNATTGDFTLVISGSQNVGVNGSLKIEDMGNNIWRVSGNHTASGTSLANNGIVKFTSQSSKGFRVVGWQLEAGANATSYIPTVASAVTRNADVISKTGLSGITTITETFEDGSTNVISGSPTSYTMSQGRIKSVVGI